MTQRIILAAMTVNRKPDENSGYAISEQDAAKLRVPERTNVAPGVIAKAQAIMADIKISM